MWLIDRDTDGVNTKRTPLPAPLRDALVRWYVGKGVRADEEAGIELVQQARIGKKWIACDCLEHFESPPILTPAFLSEAETYYLRRLTGSGRPEHKPACPFFRDAATNRISEVRSAAMAAEPAEGYFEVLRPAPEKLAKRPENETIDDRTRQAAVPRLARLLWRLMDLAGVARISSPVVGHKSSISGEFSSLVRAAARINVAPGVELGRVLWTHAEGLHSGRAFERLGRLKQSWPRGHASQGFLILFSPRVHGHVIEVAGGDPVMVANRVQSSATRDNKVSGPFLVLVVLGEYPEAKGFAALRAYAQPIFSGRHFFPILSDGDREIVREVFRARSILESRGIHFHFERPLFDMATPLGLCRPEFLVEARSVLTGAPSCWIRLVRPPLPSLRCDFVS